MKNNDLIRQYEHSLFIHFGTTGELQLASTIALQPGVTFHRDGMQILANPLPGGGAEPRVVERFSSEQLCKTAFDTLQQVLKSYVRRRRLAGVVKGGIKWVFTPLMVLIVALGLNMFASRATGLAPVQSPAATEAQPPHYGNPYPTAGQPAQAAAPMPSTQPYQSQIPGLPPLADPSVVSKAVTAGVKAGKYSVQLSQGSKGVLYVFSDPTCPHCQEFEPQLEQLANDYTIQLFPVSVIGGDVANRRVAKMLCAKPEERAGLWKKIINDRDLDDEACAEGLAAVSANDQIFRKMRFLGTPTIINGQGVQSPLAVPNTAVALNEWLERSAPQ